METIKPFVVLTTIAKPTLIALQLIMKANSKGYTVVVVGDKKTPKSWKNLENICYIPWNEGELTNSYSRKNIGYRYAIEQGATHIFDMDDDNDPMPEWGQVDFSQQTCRLSTSTGEWLNIYKIFGQPEIWPRGLPLHALYYADNFEFVKVPDNVVVWQSLCNNDPDTDAIWRLINSKAKKEFYFGTRSPTVLTENTICPFNAQNTLFKKEAFPLLYLPSSVSMRFSDILRSVIAQPILWAAGYRVGFTGSTVFHIRHHHDLMTDFYNEIECYANIEQVYQIVKDKVKKENTITENLVDCYYALYNESIIRASEITTLIEWVAIESLNE
jgi:hypothetical protein